ncbi:MAG: hypothetical protein JWL72_4449 [Ilumatobacteraceae bacterium]|nr:hypothetical protein [Ilumatobacteraceae bacterium]
MAMSEPTQSAPSGARESNGGSAGEIRDALPDDLNAGEFVGPYQFPDNSRRRIPGVIYLVVAIGCFLLWLTSRSGQPVAINRGMLAAAILLGAFGIFCLTSGWRMQIDEKQALVAATGAVGFAVGHASAQQVWRGLRSRPTWRVLCYSVENPPRQRGLVLVDAVDGEVLQHLVQANPETDWEEPDLS